MIFVATGNPVDGFTYIGPFDTNAAAVGWATDHCIEPWWNVTLTKPEDYEA